MNYNIIAIPKFKKELKRLAKKYHSLKNEYAVLIEQLEQDPKMGTPIGNDCFKIRISIASKNKGKSGSARVITHFYVAGKTIFLLSIYDKSEQNDIPDIELLNIIRNIR